MTVADTLTAAIAAVCRRAPDRIACRFVAEDGAVQPITFGEFFARARRWGALFRARGVPRGGIVIIIVTHSPDQTAAFVGALLAGLVPALYAPPSFKFPAAGYAATVRELLAHSGAALVVTDTAIRDQLGGLAVAESGFRGVLCREEVTLPEPLANAAEPTAAEIAFLQYSSGTTGLKKGVALRHGEVMDQLTSYAAAIGMTDRDTVVSWLPLYHDMGLVACFLLPLVTGASLVWLSPFAWVRRPASFLRLAADYRATLAWLPNFAFSFLAERVRDDELAGSDLAALRLVTNCAEVISAGSLDAFAARFERYGLRRESLGSCYAMAETTFAVTQAGGPAGPLAYDCIDGPGFTATGRATPVAPSAPGARRLAGSGRPLPGTTVTIVAGNGTEVPERTVGEVLVRSGSVMTGYHRNEPATAVALRDGWYHTGDLGYRVGNEYYIVGRARDLIIVAGINYYPDDIELLVSAVPGVRSGRCVAFGLRNESRGTEELVVLAEPDPDRPVPGDELRPRIGTALVAALGVAARIELVPPRWLGKSTSGKIARGANRDRFLADSVAADEARERSVPNASRRELLRREVTKLVRERNRTAVITDTTPLLSSGLLDSFAWTRLLAWLETECRVVIGPDQLRDPARFDSVAALAALLGEEPEAQGAVGSAPAAAPAPAPSLVMPPYQPPGSGPRRGLLRAYPWSAWYRLVFTVRGIRFGRNLVVLGPLTLRLDAGAGSLVLGDDVTLGAGVMLTTGGNGAIELGDRVEVLNQSRLTAQGTGRIRVGHDSHLGPLGTYTAAAALEIGAWVMVAGYASVITATHSTAATDQPMRRQPRPIGPIRIADNVWIGSHATLLPHTEIETGAVIGANSLVGGHVPADALCVGVPARVTGYRQPGSQAANPALRGTPDGKAGAAAQGTESESRPSVI